MVAHGEVSKNIIRDMETRPDSNVLDYAKVIFKNTTISAPINAALWEEWNASTPLTDHVTFDDYATTGSGLPSKVARPSFATLLTSSQAATFTISSAIGSDYAGWVDTAYLL